MIPTNIVPNTKAVLDKLNIEKHFDMSISSSKGGPYKNTLCMIFKQVGLMLSVYMQGPCQNVKEIKTITENWGDSNLENARSSLIKNKIYAFMTRIPEEGATIWGLVPDDSFSIEDLDGIIKNDIKGRRWMTAFKAARDKMEGEKDDKKAPFALGFIASYTENTIPWFGKVAWGLAVKENIISLTQIPLMIKTNRDQYFVWSYVCNHPVTDEELTGKYGKGGGESTYSKFKDLRDFLYKECEPLNKSGSYSFAKGHTNDKGEDEKPDKEEPDDGKARPQPKEEPNPLEQAQQEQNEESYKYSVNESIETAKAFLIDETYRIYDEVRYSWGNDDDTEYDIGDYKGTYPHGEPYLNKIKVGENIPILGPLY